MNDYELDCIAKADATMNTNVKHRIDAIAQFRLFEIAVFYCHITAILLYVVFCEVFIFLKKNCKSKVPENDPFWLVLNQRTIDFL
jgi:hypothetical protein